MSRLVDFCNETAYFAPAPTPEGAVFLLPTIMGLAPFVRSFADSLAGAGLTTLVWNPYSGQPEPTDVFDGQKRAQKLNDKSSLESMASWIDFLCEESGLTQVGVGGFCLGGRFALLIAARDRRIAGCLGYYPSVLEPMRANQDDDVIAIVRTIQCPVHIVRPGTDHVTSKETYVRLEEALRERDDPTIIEFFPHAVHGSNGKRVQPSAELEANEAAGLIARPQVTGFFRGCLSDVGRLPTSG